MSLRKKWGITIMLLLLMSVLCAGAGIWYWKTDFMRQYKKTVAASSYSCHALGGMDGHSYMNSMDALQLWYEKGRRLFEVDLTFTTDGRLVLSHGFNKNDYEKRMGLPFPPKGQRMLDYQSFMELKLYGKYPTWDFQDLVAFMKTHKDMYVLLDFKNASYEDTKKGYEAVVREAEKDEQVLDRFIAGGHTTDMIKAVKETYDFPILNLYLAAPGERDPAWGDDLDAFVSYCKENGITSYSTAPDTYTEETAEALKDSGLISYIFTVNDEEQAKRMFQQGASIVGTDFLE